MKNLIVQFPTDNFIGHLKKTKQKFKIISNWIITKEPHYIEVINYNSNLLKKPMLIGNTFYYSNN